MYGSTTSSGDSSAAQSGAVGSALTGSSVNQLYMSHSNPDLTSICYEDPRADYPEHALKVFKADQTSKYLLIHKVSRSNEIHIITYLIGLKMNIFFFLSVIDSGNNGS